MSGNIESLEEQYFKVIEGLTEFDDIKKALPEDDYVNFFSLMEGIIERIDNSVKELEKEIAIEQDKEMLLEYKLEIELFGLKKELCLQKLKKANNDVEIEKRSLVNPKKHIIFAKRSGDGTYLEKDLRNMSPEYYDRVRETLADLENGTAKIKALTGNKKLVNILEVTPFKVRVMFKNLSEDTIYVIMARVKKSDNSVLDRQEPIKRVQNTDSEYQKLKEDINNPEKREKLLKEHGQIRDDIFKYMNHHNRKG